MRDFQPIDREPCSECGRPSQGYYERRASHMAAAFRSGVTPHRISTAYGMSPDWALKIITEQLGKEAVLDHVRLLRE
jgi:hypothetical protein